MLGKIICLLIGHPNPLWAYCPADRKNYPHCPRCGATGRDNA